MNEEQIWKAFGLMMDMYENKVFLKPIASKRPRLACEIFEGCSRNVSLTV